MSNNTSLIDVASNLSSIVRATKSKSLVDFSRPARVEPLTMVDSTLRYNEIMPDIIRSLTSIFTAYYLQGVSLKAKVGNIDVVKELDALATHRSSLNGAISTIESIATESADNALFYPEGFPDYGLGIESARDRQKDNIGRSVDPRAVDKIHEVPNLSLGKVVTVTLENGEDRATVAVNIRLNVHAKQPSQVVDILSNEAKDRSTKTRKHEFLSGGLSFWQDIILCNDIINDFRKAARADEDGAYVSDIRRRQSNSRAAVLSLSPSLNTISAIHIVSKVTLKEIEREAGFRIKDFRRRNEMMLKAGIMLFCVVDAEDDELEIYHLGMEDKTHLRHREIKSVGNKEINIAEVLASYQKSVAPQF